MRAAFLCGLVATSAVAQSETLVLEGEVPADAGVFFTVPFTVPPRILDGREVVELEVRRDDRSSANVLDWGLLDPAGTFRGWGGGNSEPAVVNARAASRSYLPSPIDAGRWQVLVGQAQVTERPARSASRSSCEPGRRSRRRPARPTCPRHRSRRRRAGTRATCTCTRSRAVTPARASTRWRASPRHADSTSSR